MGGPPAGDPAVHRAGRAGPERLLESFNGRFRDECLNESWFVSLRDARETIEAWRVDYNEVRPHSSLAEATPAAFALSRSGTTPSLNQPTGLT